MLRIADFEMFLLILAVVITKDQNAYIILTITQYMSGKVVLYQTELFFWRKASTILHVCEL